MFEWTPELEASCPPVRGQGAPVDAKPVDDKKLLAAAGKTGTLESHAAEAEAFLAACNAKGVKLVDGAVDRLFAKYGAAGAIEIVALVGKAGVAFMGPIRQATIARVRHHLAHAGDYQAALDFVVGHGGLPPGLDGNPTQYQVGREIIAYLFPDHRPFFDAAIDQLVARNFTSSYLLGAVAGAQDVARFGPRGIGHPDRERHAVVVARVAREAGLPFLVEYTARSTGVPGVALALTAYVSPEAAASLALYIENKDALPIVRGYFAAHPELAAAALEPHTKSKKKKIRDAAASLLT